MSPDAQTPESDEKQLCTSCTTPNVINANFCINCGAPLSSYANIAPFERLFSEGFIYRQAAENPRKFIVVFGVWLMFGLGGMGGVIIIGLGQGSGFWPAIIADLFGGGVVLFSVIMICKCTRNYLTRNKRNEKSDV
jgi:hypothetical protein